jgi:hypothetical protein
MRKLGVLMLGIFFLFLGHAEASGFPQGLGIMGDPSSNDKELGEYTKAVRTKIGNNMSKSLVALEEGTVSLDFDISSDGKLIQVSVNNEKTKASPEMISVAITAVKQSSPFDPFPEDMAKKNSQLPFSIILSLKPAAQ